MSGCGGGSGGVSGCGSRDSVRVGSISIEGGSGATGESCTRGCICNEGMVMVKMDWEAGES